MVDELNPDFIERLKESDNEQGRGQRRVRSAEIATELNRVIDSKTLYAPEAFPTADNRERLKPLIENGVESLDAAELEQLNRELLQIVFSRELVRPRGERVWIGYAGFKLGEPLSISRRQIKQFVEPLLLGFLIKLGLGVVAVFVALIVTSPIVPETFRSGSLHLLLSKPISRVWLYLFKLLGGCVFVLFNITYVLIGLYFIAGLRFDIWNEGLLYCIPLLLFVFIIFYSVSALVGLIWGNAIVCVVACIIFWMFCFAVGAIHDGMQQHVELLPQISRADKIGDKYWAVNQRGDVSVWNEKFAVWQPALENDVGGQARTFGPLYDPVRNHVVVKAFFQVPFGNLASRSRKLSVIRLANKSSDDEQPSNASPGDSPDANTSSNSNAATTVSDTTASVAADSEKTASDATAGEPNEAKKSAAKSNAKPAKEANRDPKTLSEARTTPYWMSDTGPEVPAQLIELTQVDGDVIAVCRGGSSA